MNDFFPATPATECQALIDFRPECNQGPAPLAQVPVEPVVADPQAPPLPGADSGPLAHLDGLSLPDIDGGDVLDALAVAGVFGGSIGAVAAAGLAVARFWAWSPVRLRNFAFGSACVLPGSAVLLDGWDGPRAQVLQAVSEVVAGAFGDGVATAAVATVPAGWAVAAVAMARYLDQRETRGLRSPARTERAQWARRQRELTAAARMSAAALPLCAGTIHPNPVIGRTATVSAAAPARSALGRLTGRNESLFQVPWLAMREHFVGVGNPGSGKTTFMLRAIIAFWAAGWRMHGQWWRNDRPGRPLAIIFDIKGARDARKTFAKLKQAGIALGLPAERIACWPDDINLQLLVGSAREIETRVEALIGAGTNTEGADPAEAYYLQMRKAVVHLAVSAPDPDKGLDAGEDPPATMLDLLARMTEAELEHRWAGYPEELAALVSVTTGRSPVLPAVQTTVANIARELGPAFEGEANFTDYDIVYCCLEGITSPMLAQAQFGALVAMLTALAGTDHGRTIQLFVDEFAQVCGDGGAARIVELLRSAGVGSGWFAQSWMGLGPNDDGRHRLVDACSGGIFAMRSNSAGQLAEKIGTRRKFTLSRKIIGGGRIGDEGNVQGEDTFIVPPAVMAGFAPGDIVHVRGPQAVFGHISPMTPESVRPLLGLAESTTPKAEKADLKKGASK